MKQTLTMCGIEAAVVNDFCVYSRETGVRKAPVFLFLFALALFTEKALVSERFSFTS